MKRIAIITTGGTIASRADPTGAQVATTAGTELMRTVPLSANIELTVQDLFSANSYMMTLAHMDQIRRATCEALLDPLVAGVVVAHGTDTLEESALMVDLFHADHRPVVFTGAQRSADTLGSDGPANLRDAIAVASAAEALDLGTLVVFDGVVHAARGTRKVHTTAPGAFEDSDFGPLGRISGDDLVIQSHRLRLPPLCPANADFSQSQVDIVALYPGVGRDAIDAYVASGARGIVVEATGMGNGNKEIVAAVAEHTAAGIHIVISTRVHSGPVRALYGGGGGGCDLIAAGAIGAGYLRPSQARIQLASLIASNSSQETVLQYFRTDPEGFGNLRPNGQTATSLN